MDGIAFLKALREQGSNLPFIIFTGKGREEIVIEAFNHGADFYVQKGGKPESQFSELVHKIRQVVSHRRSEEALTTSEKRYRDVVETQQEFIFRYGPDGRLLFVNDAYCNYFGVTRDKVLGTLHRPSVPKEEVRQIHQTVATLSPENPTIDQINSFRTSEDQTHWMHWFITALFTNEGQISEYQITGHDVTEQRESQHLARQH